MYLFENQNNDQRQKENNNNKNNNDNHRARSLTSVCIFQCLWSVNIVPRNGMWDNEVEEEVEVEVEGKEEVGMLPALDELKKNHRRENGK